MTEANTIDLKLEKVLDRIRKLLNLAKGGATPEEAATAVAHAQKLMDEHHIEEAQLLAKEPSTPQEEVEKAPLDEAAKTEWWNEWERVLAGVVARSFHCEGIVYELLGRSHTTWLVGALSDRQTVAYLFRYLQTELVRLGDVGYDMQGAGDLDDAFDLDAPAPVVDTTSKAQWLKDFYGGAITVLHERLTTERKKLAAAPTYALMVSTRAGAVVKFMHDKVGNLRRGRAMTVGHSRSGFSAGRAAAQTVSLGNPGAKRLS
jgi:hypothetical protein